MLVSEIQQYLLIDDGKGCLWPTFMDKLEFLDNWFQPFVRICNERGVPTYKALAILEAIKRNLLFVSKVEPPPNGRWYL